MGLEQERKLKTTPELSRRSGLNADIVRYLTHLTIDRDRPENTISAYRNDLSQLCEHLSPRNTQFDWNGVTKARLVVFVSSLNEKGYASATLARKVAAVKSFFHWLYTEQLVRNDPTDGLDSPRIPKTLPRTMSREEVDTLLSAPEIKGGSETNRDSALLHLLCATGMRVSEMLSLTRGDISLTTDYVRCLTPKHERQIPFGLRTHDAIQKHLEDNTHTVLTKHAETDPLFVNHRGERLTRQGFWTILKGCARSVGLPGVNNHTLRHSFAVRLLDNNADVESVQRLLGHSSRATTEQHASTRDRIPKTG